MFKRQVWKCWHWQKGGWAGGSRVEDIETFIGSDQNGQDSICVHQSNSSGWVLWKQSWKTTEKIFGCSEGGHAEGLVWPKRRLGMGVTWRQMMMVTPKGSSRKKITHQVEFCYCVKNPTVCLDDAAHWSVVWCSNSCFHFLFCRQKAE